MTALLAEIDAQLGRRFQELVQSRKPLGYPIYALEHGLDPPTLEKLAAAASYSLRKFGLDRAHWRVWLALAAEAGYRYAGEEYWHLLERQKGEWKDNGLREQLRNWFMTFHRYYSGPQPTGPWASQFSIIAWPINNAILPRYLQNHFARYLFDRRYELTNLANLEAQAVGEILSSRYDGPAKSRFGYLLQQTDLTGAIVLALREERDAPSVPRISPDLLARIVADLEKTEVSRGYLRDTRAVLNTRSLSIGAGLRKGQKSTATEHSGAVAPSHGPVLAARLVSGTGVVLAVVLPNIITSLEQAGVQLTSLSSTRMRLPDAENARWIPISNLRSLAGQERVLKQLPSQGAAVIEFQNAPDGLERIVQPFNKLEPRERWVLRRFNDGIFREVAQGHIRAGQGYIVISRSPIAESDAAPAGLHLAQCPVEGLSAYTLNIPNGLSDTQAAALAKLRIGTKATVTVEPLGLAPRTDEGSGLPVWLSTEPIMIRLSADHDLAGYLVRLDQEPPTEIHATGRDTNLVIDAPDVGMHTLFLTAFPKDLGAPGTPGTRLFKTEFPFEIQSPTPWPDAVRSRAGFRLVVAPPNADFEDILAGRATLALNGPAGRQVQWTLDTLDAGGTPTPHGGESTSSRATNSEIAESLKRLANSASQAIDECHRIDVRATIDVLGEQTLRFPRQVEAVRWRYENATRQVRLIDETAHDQPITVLRVPLSAPLDHVAVDAAAIAEGQVVDRPGALFAAIYRGQLFSAFVNVRESGRLKDFGDLQPLQHIQLPAAPIDAVLQLGQAIALWSQARPLGQFAVISKSLTVQLLIDRLTVFLCGPRFAEVIGHGPNNDLTAAREMVGGSPGFRARIGGHPWSNNLDAETSEAFADYARRYRIVDDVSDAVDALSLAYDATSYRFGTGPEAEQRARVFLSNRPLIRGAYLARALGRAASDQQVRRMTA